MLSLSKYSRISIFKWPIDGYLEVDDTEYQILKKWNDINFIAYNEQILKIHECRKVKK